MFKNKYDRPTGAGTGPRPTKKYKGKKGIRKRLPPSQKPQLTSNAVTAASLYSAAAVAGGGDGGNCKRYTEDICIAAADYPSEAILAVLNRNARVGNDLIADVVDQSADSLVDGVTSAQENAYTFDHYFGRDDEIERQDNGLAAHRDFAGEGGFLCPSEIMYAKPKRGKTAQGEWKDIVNVKDYTQTLRMEKCLKPGGQCSYVSHHYKSQCSQVYNYHRLLSWNKERGLHMDIYKVPTCCSCHIMGYSYVYPPLGKGKGKSRPKHSHPFEHHLPPHHDFDNHLFPHEEERFDDFHIEHMEPHFTPSPHDDGHGFHNFVTHHTGFDARQAPSSVHVTARPHPTAAAAAMSSEDEFLLPEQHLKRRTGGAHGRPPPSSAAVTASTTPAASAGRTSHRRYRNLSGIGGQRSSVRRRRKPVKGRQRSPVSAPLLGAPPISTPTHAASSSSGPSPKTVPPPPPPPANAPKTAQLTQPQHRHPPSPLSPRRRTRLPTPSSSSTVVAADERIGDYSDDYILPGESDEDDADSKKKVNYGYHPIIDFFPMYRWSAAAAAAAAARK